MLTEEKLKEIKEARNKLRVPLSLNVLAIKAIVKHCILFDDIPFISRLKYLRKS